MFYFDSKIIRVGPSAFYIFAGPVQILPFSLVLKKFEMAVS